MADGTEPADLRLLVLGVVAWAGALWGTLTTWSGPTLGVVLGVVLLGWVRTHLAARRGRPGPSRDLHLTAAAAALVFCAVLTSATLRHADGEAGALAQVAERGSPVTVTGVVSSDPRVVPSAFGETVVVRVQVRDLVTARGRWRVRTPAVVLGEGEWSDVRLGSLVEFRAVATEADGDAAALLSPRGAPRTLREPDSWWRGAEVVRAGIRKAVEPRPVDQRALVPSLVVGDDAGLDPALAEDFRATGLTHLLAVSGTNLTLMLGFVVLVSRWVGVRGRGRYVVGALTIVGFVLVARGEPSVVRAATMGTVAMLALAHDGRRRGVRTLGAAVVGLLCWDPGLATTAGFALSVLATAGILLLAPVWRDALARWLPRPVAEAIAVPAAAQLACTPVVAGISGQVSLVAVAANVLVAPAVAPATVLGLLGGGVAVVWPGLGQLIAWPAAWSVGWIIAVARAGAGLATPSVAWGSGPLSLALLVVLCLVLVWVAPALLSRPGLTLALGSLTALLVLFPLPRPGWPPPGWVMAACDVGQGDALVLRAAPGQAVVIDAGPDPSAVDDCLRRLRIEAVPLLVLTHFHADHIDGLPGVLRGRRVGAVEVSPVADPASGAAWTTDQLEGRGLVTEVSTHLQTRVVGDVRLTRLWPEPDAGSGRVPQDGANDASVVLLAEVRGVSVLLTGDVEPTAQRGLARWLAGVRVDVLKVPHHGSRHQDVGLLTGLGARVALVSAGRDNTYGHPAPELLDQLESVGMVVLRTDRSSDVVVVERDGALATTTLR